MTQLTPVETEFIIETLQELKSSEHYNPEVALEAIEQAVEILDAAYRQATEEPDAYG